LNVLERQCITRHTKASAECTRLKRAVLVGGHLARLAIPKDCEPGGDGVRTLPPFYFSSDLNYKGNLLSSRSCMRARVSNEVLQGICVCDTRRRRRESYDSASTFSYIERHGREHSFVYCLQLEFHHKELICNLVGLRVFSGIARTINFAREILNIPLGSCGIRLASDSGVMFFDQGGL
jgi:hypothetical protein